MGITLWQYYVNTASRITDTALSGVETLQDWEAVRDQRRREFFLSVGLDPMPEKCDLKVTGHGEFSGEGYRARKIAFQILPDVWATACVFTPDPMPTTKLPAVLYVSGHSTIGVWGYQGHGSMWARRGYVCLILDTVEQHDNPGEHHGTYYGRRYDWVSMGYSGAGGELWNSIRALDVLAGLPEVDVNRIGATGNSGGGALSFFIGIADERIKAVATSCGVTRPKHTIARRNFQRHCDCIYNHNPFQRDTAEFAAIMAPRPMLYCFAKDDYLFTPDEFRSLTEATRKVYRLYGREECCDLFEYSGPHGYQPQSIAAINAWFDKHVAGEDHPAGQLGQKEPESVTAIFNGVPPEPDRLDLLPDILTPRGSVRLPANPEDWKTVREEAVRRLHTEVFHTLDTTEEELVVTEVGDWQSGPDPKNRRKAYAGVLGGMDMWMHTIMRPGDKLIVGLCGRNETAEHTLSVIATNIPDHTIVGIEPRGAGFTGNRDQEHHILRVAVLTGITPTMLLLHDLKHALAFLMKQPYAQGKKIYLYGRGEAGVACLYHAVLNENIAGVVTEDIPSSHHDGAHILGILRVMDIGNAVGLVAPRPVAALRQPPIYPKHWAARVYERLGCPDGLMGNWTSLQSAFGRVLAAKA